MDGDRPDSGPSHPGGEPRGPEFVEARAAVEWQFGDLVERVAVDHPITGRHLVRTLAAVEREAQRREARLLSAGTRVHCDLPGAVLRLPRGAWQSIERAEELTEHEAVAVRDIHRRLAEPVTAGAPDRHQSGLFVLCSTPSVESP
jgi:hypothetical protein